MRKILLMIIVNLALFSCSNDNDSTNDIGSSVKKCPIIRELESSQKGDFMIVNISGDLNNHNLDDREKYKILIIIN